MLATVVRDRSVRRRTSSRVSATAPLKAASTRRRLCARTPVVVLRATTSSMP